MNYNFLLLPLSVDINYLNNEISNSLNDNYYVLKYGLKSPLINLNNHIIKYRNLLRLIILYDNEYWYFYFF